MNHHVVPRFTPAMGSLYTNSDLVDFGSSGAKCSLYAIERCLKSYSAEKHAEYFFSETDEVIAATILAWCGLEEKYMGFDAFPSDSMRARCMEGEFESECCLEVVYRNDEVVILRLSGP